MSTRHAPQLCVVAVAVVVKTAISVYIQYKAALACSHLVQAALRELLFVECIRALRMSEDISAHPSTDAMVAE